MPPADTQQRDFPSVIPLVGISDSYFYLLKFYSYLNEQLKYLLLKGAILSSSSPQPFPFFGVPIINTFAPTSALVYLPLFDLGSNLCFRAGIGHHLDSSQCLELA